MFLDQKLSNFCFSKKGASGKLPTLYRMPSKKSKNIVSVDQNINFNKKYIQDALKQKPDEKHENLPFGITVDEDDSNWARCNICSSLVAKSNVRTHVDGKGHIVKLLYLGLKNNRFVFIL